MNQAQPPYASACVVYSPFVGGWIGLLLLEWYTLFLGGALFKILEEDREIL